MRPLSLDLRTRVVAAAQETGERSILLGRRFDVPEANVRRWLAQFAATGSVEPKAATGGRAPRISDDELVKVRILVESSPGATVAELAQRWTDHTGVTVAEETFRRTLIRAGISHKKTVFAQASETVRTSSKSEKSLRRRRKTG